MMDIKDFINRFDNTTNDIFQIVKAYSSEQLTFKRDSNWCILEILEHILLTDRVIYSIISKPSTEINESPEIVGNNKLEKQLVEHRGKKIISPDILKPKGEIKNFNEFEKSFLAQIESIKSDISTGIILVDNRIHKHPLLNEMTITDWLNFMIHHTQRHIEQIKDTIKQMNT